MKADDRNRYRRAVEALNNCDFWRAWERERDLYRFVRQLMRDRAERRAALQSRDTEQRG